MTLFQPLHGTTHRTGEGKKKSTSSECRKNLSAAFLSQFRQPPTPMLRLSHRLISEDNRSDPGRYPDLIHHHSRIRSASNSVRRLPRERSALQWPAHASRTVIWISRLLRHSSGLAPASLEMPCRTTGISFPESGFIILLQRLEYNGVKKQRRHVLPALLFDLGDPRSGNQYEVVIIMGVI